MLLMKQQRSICAAGLRWNLSFFHATACYETTTFNDATCWDMAFADPAACYETTTLRCMYWDANWAPKVNAGTAC
jgi:hypothetical protein